MLSKHDRQWYQKISHTKRNKHCVLHVFISYWSFQELILILDYKVLFLRNRVTGKYRLFVTTIIFTYYNKIWIKKKIQILFIGKGGKNRRRGKNENENEKRELVFKEDGQGKINLHEFWSKHWPVIWSFKIPNLHEGWKN